jgi:hypothetical protein
MTSDLSPQEKELKQSSQVFFGNCVKSEAGLAQTQQNAPTTKKIEKFPNTSQEGEDWEQKGHPEHKVLVPMPLSVITVILLRQIMTKNIQKLA